MFKEHKFIIWGTQCECGNECSILQNEHHPWDDIDFTVKLKCSLCKKEVIIDRERAELFYNKRIYSYFNDITGTVIDLGCGGGFLSRYLLNNNKVNKVYGLDIDSECETELEDIMKETPRFEFIVSNSDKIDELFKCNKVDYLVSRDVFMFIEDTDRYFDNITKIVNKEIRQMAWYMEGNKRMKNKLTPEQIAEEYIKRGWDVKLEYLDWYKSGYFIRAYR